MKEKEMWEGYTKVNPSATKYEVWSFGGNTPEISNQLALLVFQKVKTATASAYDIYVEYNELLPQKGHFNIILDTDDNAVCITKTSKVYITPFCEVTEKHAFKEGELDRTLASWRKGHKEFFTKELKAINKEFSEEMLVVCEEFELVYPIEKRKIEGETSFLR